jgi:hypothetical protein
MALVMGRSSRRLAKQIAELQRSFRFDRFRIQRLLKMRAIIRSRDPVHAYVGVNTRICRNEIEQLNYPRESFKENAPPSL